MCNLDHDTTLTANIAILNEFDRCVPVYDDGSGPLWVYRESLGIVGVVRASTWEDAYEIVENEFMAEAGETLDEIAEDCEWAAPEDLMDNAIFQEGYGFRPSGPNVRDIQKHGVYQKDLNGERLDLLTPKLMKHLGLTLVPAPNP